MRDAIVAGHLYRIAQEATNNALKHSRAREIVIALKRQRGHVTLRVSDDGCGLTEGKSSGMGLHVMRHRASVIGAELTLESAPGKGTTVICRWPEKS
jgi:signal transduction histidine kinase